MAEFTGQLTLSEGDIIALNARGVSPTGVVDAIRDLDHRCATLERELAIERAGTSGRWTLTDVVNRLRDVLTIQVGGGPTDPLELIEKIDATLESALVGKSEWRIAAKLLASIREAVSVAPDCSDKTLLAAVKGYRTALATAERNAELERHEHRDALAKVREQLANAEHAGDLELDPWADVIGLLRMRSGCSEGVRELVLQVVACLLVERGDLRSVRLTAATLVSEAKPASSRSPDCEGCGQPGCEWCQAMCPLLEGERVDFRRRRGDR